MSSQTQQQTTPGPVVDLNGNGRADYTEPEVWGGVLGRYAVKHPKTIAARIIRAVFGIFGK